MRTERSGYSSSPALANHLALRDYLRRNAEATREYGALKKQLAEKFGDDRYITLACRSILQ